MGALIGDRMIGKPFLGGQPVNAYLNGKLVWNPVRLVVDTSINSLLTLTGIPANSIITWGDGQRTVMTSAGTATHVYEETGLFTVNIY
jgi:hypothetical protein